MYSLLSSDVVDLYGPESAFPVFAISVVVDQPTLGKINCPRMANKYGCVASCDLARAICVGMSAFSTVTILLSQSAEVDPSCPDLVHQLLKPFIDESAVEIARDPTPQFVEFPCNLVTVL